MTTTTRPQPRPRYETIKGTRGQTRVNRVLFIDLLDAERDAEYWIRTGETGTALVDRYAIVRDTETGDSITRYNMQTTAVISEMRS